ncbi:KTSC domain-containing protein [Parapedobacter indicus]|uniref:KTSC domain-containing protein n=1 Tax=Parapedobacter indicus TaxID=1477437 RepID=A0A1I3V031_9SPHI|nr:KTSC domain-containing protein [Parapedobacter indicus]PPK99026.1 KTSC domain-containing protein [Parapedobacter indicus]SFJ88283.1 KTSC domain-containing protein [Parapedobacter indicus]
MKTVNINGVDYQVDDRFADFTIHQKPSSNVAFFGYNEDGHFFIQFQNGGAYVYEHIEADVIAGAVQAESIGKYYRAFIAVKHPSTKLTDSIVLVPEKAVDF